MRKSIQLLVSCTLLLTSLAQAQWSSNQKIKGNGNVISGVAEDLVVDIGGPGKSMKTFGLRFIEAGTNVGWAII